LSHPPDILAEPPDILVPSTGHSCQQACKCEAACEAGARPLFQNLTLYEHYIEHLYEQRVLRNLFLKILENGSTAGRETWPAPSTAPGCWKSRYTALHHFQQPGRAGVKLRV